MAEEEEAEGANADDQLQVAMAESMQALHNVLHIFQQYTQQTDAVFLTLSEQFVAFAQSIASWAALLQDVVNHLYPSRKDLRVGARGGLSYLDTRGKRVWVTDPRELRRCWANDLVGVANPQGCQVLMQQSAKWNQGPPPDRMPGPQRFDRRTRRRFPDLPPAI